MQLADTDGDGEMEWVGLYESHAQNASGISGFVLDGNVFYQLGERQKGNPFNPMMGDIPVCDLATMDINLDGVVEIVVRGKNRAGMHHLAMFAWDNNGAYPLLASFAGTANARLSDENGDGAADIIVENSIAPGVILQEISLWDDGEFIYYRSQYAQAENYDGPLPLDTPEHTLISFYLYLNQRNLATAYQILSPKMQHRQSYQDFVLSTAAIKQYLLGEFSEIVFEGSGVVLKGQLATELARGVTTEQQKFYGEWKLEEIKATGGWRIDNVLLIAE